MRGQRYDYFLVWGHGVHLVQQILDMIRSNGALKIVKILHHVPGTVEELIHAVYSFDYAPIEHLRGKTEYLKRTPREAYFIFVQNSAPDEDYFGEGPFRHIESQSIKALKEQIRDRFNPRSAGKRSEDHVIHASDNQLQTDHILSYLGYPGLELFDNRNLALKAPYHLGEISEYAIRYLPISAIRCRVVTGGRFSYAPELTDIENTPHYRALCGDCEPYRLYLEKFLGTALTDDHTLPGLLGLKESFRYLLAPFDSDYVIVREAEERQFVVLDGVHRVAVLKHQGVDALHVAVLN